VYDSNPEHPWNRLYRAIAVRTERGIPYGADNSEPYGEPFDDPQEVRAALDEFLERHAEKLAPGNLGRALLLNDLWTAFDLAASPVMMADSAALRARLARVIARLRLPRSAVSGLPDNYQQAVRSGKFAADFDPAHPEQPFLPPDLFDPNGPWVRIQDGTGAPAAAMHVEIFSGRSEFLVFIRCPGGRQATLAYLTSLNLYRTPFELRPAEIGTQYPSGEPVRWDPLRLDPRTPQFPPGTMFALVRRMMVVDEALQPIATAITQKVQIRVYRQAGGAADDPQRNEFQGRQVAVELVMRRRALLAGQQGGLRALPADATEYQAMLTQMGVPRDKLLEGTVVLARCVRCHNGDGIFSVNTYRRTDSGWPRTLNPQLLPAADLGYEEEVTRRWKESQFNWGLLRGLLEAQGVRVGAGSREGSSRRGTGMQVPRRRERFELTAQR
jgi:hypothetical protein